MTIKKIAFTKMHSLGNDFMVIDAIKCGFVPNKTQLKQWSNRHFGVGFDQLLLIEPSLVSGIDFKYRIFNANGSEVEMCGNGTRCFAKYISDMGLSAKKTLSIETINRIIQTTIETDGQVQVSMGVPNFEPTQIPLNLSERHDKYHIDFKGKSLYFWAMSIGNPHAVFMVDDVGNADVLGAGAFVESHSIFPQKTNVGFMQIINQTSIRLRVFERGVGETLSCGSGACAAVVAGIQAGKLLANNDILVHTSGGNLSIVWAGENTSPKANVWMKGDACLVYHGEILP